MFKALRHLVPLHRIDITHPLKRNIGGLSAHVPPPPSDKLPAYEVTKDPEEWSWVEGYIRPSIIPDAPTEKKVFSSGWKPQTVKPGEYPYFIRRSKNHMIPVYLYINDRGLQRRTIVKNIDGDIWKFAEDLKEFLMKKNNTHRIHLRVHEIGSRIWIHRDHVNNIKIWLQRQGF